MRPLDMDGNDIYITLAPGTRLHIIVTPPQTPLPPQSGEPAAGVTAALRRLERSGSPHVREAADGLLALGYTLVAPQVRIDGKRAENYLRFHDPVRPGPAVGYLTPRDISFTRDRARLAGEPGGRVIPSTSEVAFSHADGATRGLEVARQVKAQGSAG
jgi:hypothetical protein